MPIASSEYNGVEDKIAQSREVLIKKWRDNGCTESKINKLIMRKMRSKRQWW